MGTWNVFQPRAGGGLVIALNAPSARSRTPGRESLAASAVRAGTAATAFVRNCWMASIVATRRLKSSLVNAFVKAGIASAGIFPILPSFHAAAWRAPVISIMIRMPGAEPASELTGRLGRAESPCNKEMSLGMTTGRAASSCGEALIIMRCTSGPRRCADSNKATTSLESMASMALTAGIPMLSLPVTITCCKAGNAARASLPNC